MAVKLETMIDLLNKDLGLEYTAIVQYAQHSGVITGAEYGDITKETKIHATEELQHAITLSEQIGYLGGSPRSMYRQPKHLRTTGKCWRRTWRESWTL